MAEVDWFTNQLSNLGLCIFYMDDVMYIITEESADTCAMHQTRILKQGIYDKLSSCLKHVSFYSTGAIALYGVIVQLFEQDRYYSPAWATQRMQMWWMASVNRIVEDLRTQHGFNSITQVNHMACVLEVRSRMNHICADETSDTEPDSGNEL